MSKNITAIILVAVSVFSLIALSFSYVFADDQAEAEGYAVIVQNRKDIARESAINNAFRRAVEQAVGVLVTSETAVSNFELLNDKIYSKSAGYIKKYTIINENIEGDVFRVTIRAIVAKVKLNKDLDEAGLTIKKAGKPRILMLITEQNIIGEPSSSWGTGDTGNMGVVENTMLSKFMDKGFNFVDRNVIAQMAQSNPAIARTSNMTNDLALKLASEGEAEVVILGQAVAKASPTLMGTNMRSCQATVSLRAINADTGEPIATFTTNGVAAHIDQITGGSDALKKAASDMSDRLIPQILAKWKKRVSGEYMVKLVIKGMNFSSAKKFKEFLQATVESIEGMYDRGYKDGILKLDIEVAENARDIAEAISAKKFEGGSFDVTSLTSNIVQMKFTKK